MARVTFRLAAAADKPAIVAFMRRHWETRHPLVELPDFFDYYYNAGGGRLRFALAEREGKLAALAGYVPASARSKPDIWLSLWAANPAAKGSGLELMAEMPRLTGCRTLACNNIRLKTRPLYEFLGYTTGRIGHFYRLARQAEYRIAQVAGGAVISPVAGCGTLEPLEDETALRQSGFVPPKDANPQKDMWYIMRRYFRFPRQHYRVYAARLPGERAPFALLAARKTEALGSAALRIVDYIGPAQDLPALGSAIDGLIRQAGAEYADLYCAGVPAELLRRAGFAEREEGGSVIIPTYLNPPLIENVEYYYFTSRPDGFTLFKADGDQDRPNVDN